MGAGGRGGGLKGRRYLVTGVLTTDSLAYAVASELQRRGAEVMLTGFGRSRRLTERTAALLDPAPPIVELDVTDEEQCAALPRAIEEHWDALDGVVHAIAHAPADALGGNFLTTPPESAEVAFRVSAYSFKSIATATLPLLRRSDHGGSVVGLDFDASRAWLGYDWMGVAKAGLESVCRYLACYLGPAGVRVNLVALGPMSTVSASALPQFRRWSESFVSRAPLGWSVDDREVAAGPVCFLLSDDSARVTGEILHVDGGYRAAAEHMPDLPPLDELVPRPVALDRA